MADPEDISNIYISYSFGDNYKSNFLIKEQDRKHIYEILDYLVLVINGQQELNDTCQKIAKLIDFISKLNTIYYFMNNCKSESKLYFYEFSWELRCFLVDLLMKNITFFKEIYNLKNEYADDDDKIRRELSKENEKLSLFLKNELDLQTLDLDYNQNSLKDSETINQTQQLTTIEETSDSQKSDDDSTQSIFSHQSVTIEETTDSQKSTDETQSIGSHQLENEVNLIDNLKKIIKERQFNNQMNGNDLINSQNLKNTNQKDAEKQQINNQMNGNDLINNQHLANSEDTITDKEKDAEKQQINNQMSGNNVINSQNLENSEDTITDKEKDAEKQQINNQVSGNDLINNQHLENSEDTIADKEKDAEKEIIDEEKLINDSNIIDYSDDNRQLSSFHNHRDNNHLVFALKNYRQPDEKIRPNKELNKELIEEVVSDLLDNKLNEIYYDIFEIRDQIDQDYYNLINRINYVDVTKNFTTSTFTIKNIRKFFNDGGKRCSQIFYCRGIPWYIMAEISRFKEKIDRRYQYVNYLNLKLVPEFRSNCNWDLPVNCKFYIKNINHFEEPGAEYDVVYQKEFRHVFRNNDVSSKNGFGIDNFIKQEYLFDNDRLKIFNPEHSIWSLTIHVDLIVNKLIRF